LNVTDDGDIRGDGGGSIGSPPALTRNKSTVPVNLIGLQYSPIASIINGNDCPAIFVDVSGKVNLNSFNKDITENVDESPIYIPSVTCIEVVSALYNLTDIGEETPFEKVTPKVIAVVSQLTKFPLYSGL